MPFALALALPGCTPPLADWTLVGDDPPSRPLAGLDETWLDRFAAGDAWFETAFRETTGLGPVYIRTSCAACHADDGRGPGLVEKFAAVDADGAPVDADLPWGHTRRPYVAGGATTPIEIPDVDGLLVTVRAPNPVFGRGYLEAVRDDAILDQAAQQATRTDGISGRPNLVPWQSAENPDARFHDLGPGDEGAVGRFALKARIATVDDFVADAFQGDMSLTSPLRPDELPNPDGRTDDALPGIDIDVDAVNLVADYVWLLDIPARTDAPGIDVFTDVGCAVCHVPTMPTRDDYPIPPLAGIDAPVYADLLLHDMGVDAGDGLPEFEAGASEWRTAPLIGLRYLRTYLHDGRASSVAEAIAEHRRDGSEANTSIDAYDALSPAQRAELTAFVETL